MRVEGRLAVVGLVLVLGLAAVGARLWWLQVHSRKEILATPYQDRRTLALLERLRKQGILSPGDQGRVRVDARRLEQAVGTARARRIRRLVARARLYPGQAHFDPRLLRIRAPQRRWSGPVVLRGEIHDRRGRVLARGGPHTPGGRRYPLGACTQPVLGFWHAVFGSRGLEAALEPVLSTPDQNRGATRRLRGRPARPGVEVWLTLDGRLQHRLWQLMQGRRGAAVVLEVATGAVLAAVSRPAFDPNTPDPADWRRARREQRGRRLRSRAWEELYPPGSTFKLVTAAAWLEDHPPSREPVPVEYCPGRDRRLHISDLSPHGRLDLGGALVRSCNVFFARLGVRLGPRVPALARRLGFNRPLDLIPQLGTVTLPAQPSLAYARYRYRRRATPTGLRVERSLEPFTSFRRDPKIVAQCAIGQNLVAATPLQMAVVAQTIANGGFLVPPHLVRSIGRPGAGREYQLLDPPRGRQVISPETAAFLRRAMVEVMRRGTGRRAPALRLGEKVIPVAGKTGTAETGRPGDKPHAWFVGFAPADHPRLTIALVLENAGLGGRQAAPLAVAMLAAALEEEKAP